MFKMASKYGNKLTESNILTFKKVVLVAGLPLYSTGNPDIMSTPVYSPHKYESASYFYASHFPYLVLILSSE